MKGSTEYLQLQNIHPNEQDWYRKEESSHHICMEKALCHCQNGASSLWTQMCGVRGLDGRKMSFSPSFPLSIKGEAELSAAT